MSTETREQLEARIAAAKARTAELRAQHEKREEQWRLEAEAREAEVEAEAIAALEAALNDGYRLGSTLARVEVRYANGDLIGVVLVKKPNPMHWSKYENTIGDAKGVKNDELRDDLWRKCLVWPNVEQVEALIKEQPWTRQRLIDHIAYMAGVRLKELEGK